MTEEREEILLSQVGEMKGVLETFVKNFDDLRPTFATHIEVEQVAEDLAEHKEGHITRRTLIATWASAIFAFVTGIVAFLK
jgi:hypothetical protein